MTLLGGLGTIFGPLVGAALVVGLQNYLATIGDLVSVVIGLVFVGCACPSSGAGSSANSSPGAAAPRQPAAH